MGTENLISENLISGLFPYLETGFGKRHLLQKKESG